MRKKVTYVTETEEQKTGPKAVTEASPEFKLQKASEQGQEPAK